MAQVLLESVGKRFGPTPLFVGLKVEVAAGELLVLAGPSGSGKSTLLRLIAGLERLDVGTIRIDGRRVDGLPPHRRNVTLLAQRPALYPHWNVRRNLMFLGPGQSPSRTVEEVAGLLRLTGLLERQPGELSGGERQRVALGRAMLRNPDVFLLDEPLSHLDGPTREELRAEIPLLRRRSGATMICVTHDAADVWPLADRLLVLEGGVVTQAGSPADLQARPASAWVARFLAARPS